MKNCLLNANAKNWFNEYDFFKCILMFICSSKFFGIYVTSFWSVHFYLKLIMLCLALVHFIQIYNYCKRLLFLFSTFGHVILNQALVDKTFKFWTLGKYNPKYTQSWFFHLPIIIDSCISSLSFEQYIFIFYID